MRTSPLLAGVPGVTHGFTTREGGVSTGAYASLNLGLTFGGGDDPARVEQNRDRLRLQLEMVRVASVRQVHGRTVVDETAAPETEADGVVARTPGTLAMVLVADCAPVLLARADGTAVAAVHAGWRGAVARIASEAVRQLGTTDVRVAVGPRIGACCFEVGPEVVEAARAVAGNAAVRTVDGQRPHVDLGAVVRADLVDAGVLPEHVDVLDACTVCGGPFFSHRRDKGVTGRQAGVIGRRADGLHQRGTGGP